MRQVRSLSVGLLVAIGACATKSASPDSSKVTQAAAAPATRATFDAATHTATIYGNDYSFESPDTITSGLTTLHFVNEGKTLHHVQLVRLDSGKTEADVEAAAKAGTIVPAWETEIGGANAPDPGASSETTLDIAPGNYLLVCEIDVPEHVSHIARGMHKALVVVASTDTTHRAPPTADLSIGLTDFAFTITGPLTAGKHTVHVTNTGARNHEAVLIKLEPGKTLQDFAAWVQKPAGPPPAHALGGAGAMATKRSAWFDATLSAGNYALLCFITDPQTRKPHLALGMVKPFTVN